MNNHRAASPSLAGRQFGRITVLEFAGIRETDRSRWGTWRCQCACGKIWVVADTGLKSGRVKSCGCSRKGRVVTYAPRKRLSPERVAYHAMRSRCYNVRGNGYADYGGRGITVCDRWMHGEDGKTGVECFLEDMGPRPSPSHSIDRRDNDGPYSNANCRWATLGEQGLNKRNTAYATINGVTKPLKIWALESGIAYATLHRRRKQGWPESQLLGPRRPRVAPSSPKRGWKRSPEATAKAIATRKARGYRHSEATREKMRIAAAARNAKKPPE